MKNKTIIPILIFIILSFMITSCGNSNITTITQRDNFENSIEKVIEIINNADVAKYQNEYNYYNIQNDFLMGINYNNETLDYDFNIQQSLENFDLKSGFIVQKKDKSIYIIAENDKFCAVKDFNDSSISIYNIDEHEKCHQFYLLDDELELSVRVFEIEYGELYTPGTISDSYIQLFTYVNLLDNRAVNYQWYRNGEKLEDGNVMDYTIVADNEDADYYVEVTTPNGDSYKSETINVKIDRNNQ